MIFPYAIDKASNVVLVTLSGTVRGSDIAATIEALYRDPAWIFGLESIWDGTNIVELFLAASDLPGFIALEQRNRSIAGPGRLVLVVTRPIDKIMAQLYAAMSRTLHRTIHLCTTVTEASEILHRPHA